MADLVGHAGGLHGKEASSAPAGDGEVFDESVFDGIARCEMVAQAGEEGGEPGGVFTFDDDGFGEYAVSAVVAGGIGLASGGAGPAGFGAVAAGGRPKVTVVWTNPGKRLAA